MPSYPPYKAGSPHPASSQQKDIIHANTKRGVRVCASYDPSGFWLAWVEAWRSKPKTAGVEPHFAFIMPMFRSVRQTLANDAAFAHAKALLEKYASSDDINWRGYGSAVVDV